MSLENGASTAQNDILARKIELLELELKKRDVEAAAKSPAAKPWWSSLVEILALPAAIIAIVFQLTQMSGNVQTEAKTEAETSKIRVEEIKTRAELQEILDTLAEKKQKGVVAYRDEIEKTIPKLQETVDRLRTANLLAAPGLLGRSLAKFVLLWILIHAVSLAFDVISQIWGAFISSLSIFSNGMAEKLVKGRDKYGNVDYKKVNKIRSMISLFTVMLSFVPSILRWSIQISIFLALFIPLFDEIILALGSNRSFNEVLTLAKQYDLSGMLAVMKEILFGGKI
ncbi:hypothetical protein [Methylocystis sp. S23]